MRRDSPVEMTGRAHLVSTHCDECGTSVSVDADTAARRPVTCDDCTHDCLDHFDDGRNDPATPDHIVHYECTVCGQWFEFDTETGEHEVDR